MREVLEIMGLMHGEMSFWNIIWSETHWVEVTCGWFGFLEIKYLHAQNDIEVNRKLSLKILIEMENMLVSVKADNALPRIRGIAADSTKNLSASAGLNGKAIGAG